MEPEQTSKAAKSRASRLARLIFIPWAALVLYGLNDWRLDIARAHRALTTSGTITAVERQNHQQRDYTYEVAGTTYQGSCVLCAENKDEGSPVIVGYDPLDPSISTLNDFATEGSRPVPLALCVIGAVFMYFGLRRFLLRHMDDE